MVYQVPHYIQGKMIYPGDKDKKLPIYNPATGLRIAEVGIADQNRVNEAVLAAEQAFKSWSTTTPSQRAKLLFHYKALLEENVNSLAALITQEHGKTLAEAISSIRRGIDVIDYACGIPTHLKSVYINAAATEVDCYSLRQPLGVCIGITPFNFPGMIPLWMFPLAIACGNTFILKTSEKDPSCGLRLVELAEKAGIPSGVVNVVQGDKETVDALLTHPMVKAVSFVGSTAVAEYVYQTATHQGKRAQAFGGSKNHCIVMNDADLDQAAENITQAAFGCAGERCMAISVVLAMDEIADELCHRLQKQLAKIKVGPGDNPETDMGPLITQEHLQKVRHYLDLGVAEGAKLIVDGRRSDLPAEGFYLGSSLFDQVTASMRIYKEEIFGPVLCLLRVSDFATAIKLINEHEYGNGTAIFTRDGFTARTFAAEVQVGMVGINVPVPVPVAFHSFGGWKHSVFGDLDMYGAEGVQFYTKLKTVTQRWIKGEKWF